MKKRIAVIALVLGVMIGTMALPSFAAGASAPKITGSVGYTAYGLQRYATLNNISESGECSWAWNITGTWNIDFTLNGTAGVWTHDALLTQAGAVVTGSGGYPAGGSYVFEWSVTSGSVTGNQISLTMDYTLGAVGTTMHMAGTIAADGSMSGTWDDNYFGARTGNWTSSTGAAHVIAGRNTFSYSDVNGGWYTVCVTSAKVAAPDAWFAGPVVAGSAGMMGNWLFAKVHDGGEPSVGNDMIWGWFVSMSDAVTGVTTGANPPGGQFAITSGNLQVH